MAGRGFEEVRQSTKASKVCYFPKRLLIDVTSAVQHSCDVCRAAKQRSQASLTIAPNGTHHSLLCHKIIKRRGQSLI